MGCCVSSAKPSDSHKHHHSLLSDAIQNRASHPLAEEETVKEVLSVSETPKPKPPQQDYQPTTKPVFDDVKDNKNNDDEDEDKIDKFHSPINAATDNDVSELSEVYSLSESVSTTTTKRDEDEEVRQRVHRSSPARAPQRSRAYSGDLGMGAKRERLLGKSPTRRSDQSPGRINSGSLRFVHGREPIAGRGLRAAEPPPHRRNLSGEASCRRSRSPATRVDNGPSRSVMGRSPSARRTNRSPSRVKSAPTETNTRKMEQTKNDIATEGKSPTTTTNESLENPLVSLECFIFL